MITNSKNLRPEKLDEVIGQFHIMPLLKKLVEKQEKISLLLYGTPGIGKTSLAYALCNEWHVSYSYFNAAINNKKDLLNLIKFNDYIILDELHRLNRDKQDILLPALELGKIKIIATTTENPYFVVSPGVRSRLMVLELKELAIPELVDGMQKIINKLKLKIIISDKLLKEVASFSNGDFRHSINILLLLDKLFPLKRITKKLIQTVAPSMHFYSDRKGDNHYDLLSAFHKSLRGSHVNASLYYLAQLITSGDILGMERRLFMVAYEDVGIADLNLPVRVKTACDVAKRVGFPEARIPLATIVIDLCKSLKSNSSSLAIDKALSQIQQKIYPVPNHLRDGHYPSAKKLGRSVGYKLPHDYGGFVEQEYLPKELKNEKFYIKNKNDQK